MKKSKFSEEQIVGILKEADSGRKMTEVCRTHGISSYTFYKWRRQFRGMDVAEAKKLRELIAENSKLKRIVANQAIDIDCLKEVLSKKW